MKSQTKVKMLISFAIIVLIALFVLIGFQLVNIHKANKQLKAQQQQISQLQQQIDSFEKAPDSDHETITGEN